MFGANYYGHIYPAQSYPIYAAGGTTIISADGSAVGLAVVTGNAAAIWDAIGSIIGLDVTTGVGGAIWKVTFNADGTATVTGFGEDVGAPAVAELHERYLLVGIGQLLGRR